jgi:hypothetical protein
MRRPGSATQLSVAETFSRREAQYGACRLTDRTSSPSNFDYELFNCNNFNIRYWSWNYRLFPRRDTLSCSSATKSSLRLIKSPSSLRHCSRSGSDSILKTSLQKKEDRPNFKALFFPLRQRLHHHRVSGLTSASRSWLRIVHCVFVPRHTLGFYHTASHYLRHGTFTGAAWYHESLGVSRNLMMSHSNKAHMISRGAVLAKVLFCFSRGDCLAGAGPMNRPIYCPRHLLLG